VVPDTEAWNEEKVVEVQVVEELLTMLQLEVVNAQSALNEVVIKSVRDVSVGCCCWLVPEFYQ